MTSQGYNVSRVLTGGANPNDITQQRREQFQSGVAPTLQRAVVVDVIFDPTAFTDEELRSLENKVDNPELIAGMPYNSILGRVINDSQDLGHPSLYVFYPFFPSHLQLPVKPGETIFIIYEDYSRTANTQGYWMSRPMAARQIEDVNYTHSDRMYDPYNHPHNISRALISSLTASAPTFPNGGNTPESYSLTPSGTVNPFDTIANNSLASRQFSYEVVPRFRKRPGDFLAQGSNNTLIIMGTDRVGPVSRSSGSQPQDIRDYAGSIDIVAGIGSIRTLPGGHSEDPSERTYNKTAPRVIENVRGKKEVYKTPYKSQKADNSNEADPNFLTDLSRLLLSMKTKGDVNFGIRFGGSNGIFPDLNSKLDTPIDDLPSDNQDGQSFAVLKSEQVRIISKGKDPDNGFQESGEIRFLKEGTTADKDLSLFVMTKEGNIVMVGKDIQMQTHEDGKVLLRCKTSAPQDADPIVLFSKFKELLEEVHTKIDGLKSTVATQLGNMANVGLSTFNSLTPFSPIPGLISLKASLLTAQAQVDTTNVDFRAKIDPCKSKWVFINKESQ